MWKTKMNWKVNVLILTSRLLLLTNCSPLQPSVNRPSVEEIFDPYAHIKPSQKEIPDLSKESHHDRSEDVDKSADAGSNSGGRPSSYPSRHHIHKPPRPPDRLMTQLRTDADQEQPVISQHHPQPDSLPRHEDRPRSSLSSGDKKRTMPRHENSPRSSPSGGDGVQRTMNKIDVSFVPAVPAAVEEELGNKEEENREGEKEGEGEEMESLPTPQAIEGDRLRELESTANIADVYLLAVVAGCVVAAVAGLVSAGVCWYRLHKKIKATSDVEYPAYGVTGPAKERVSSPGDRKLAQSAQMYHYQHQKQQMIASERLNNDVNNQGGESGAAGGRGSDVESEEECEEGDYTVFECPGLATTGEMEVRNPMFTDQTPVATPADNK